MNHISELLKKYNVPGPRYTSYPTVPYWDVAPTESQWLKSISDSLDLSEMLGVGAALYIHIPFCESLCTYCGCNTRITRNRKVATPYVDTLLKEWNIYQEKLNRKVSLTEIHLGGGTPTFLSPKELSRLMDGILSTVGISSEFEFSVETDPRVTSKGHLEVLFNHGFRRLSLGIQDFDPKVQEIVHRVQSFEQVRETTELARAIGYTSINYDLIYGLPLQTLESVDTTINAVKELKPDRIAFYAYAHVPWIKPGQRRFTEEDLPTGDSKRALYELGRKKLEEVGYQEIGMDHFALQTDPLWKASHHRTLHRNFMGYTAKQVAPLIALGVSAIGDSWTVLMQNEKLLENYIEKVEKGELPLLRGHVLNAEDLILRRHILNLMTQLKTNWASEYDSVSFLQTIQSRLYELEVDGLVKVGKDFCEITEIGRAFLRNICMAFDARLFRKAPATEIFSRTI